MKKTLLVVVFFVFSVSSLWAMESGRQNMRDLAAAQIYEYARTLYNRKDYVEAGRAFNKILELNSNHSGALNYLRQMGLAPAPVERIAMRKKPAPVLNISTPKFVEPLDPNADLKGAIEAEQQVINQLNSELSQLRSDAEAVSNE